MNKAISTIVLLISCSLTFAQGIGEVKKEMNAKEFKSSQIIGAMGDEAFLGELNDGVLTFGIYSIGGSSKIPARKLEMVNSKNKRVPIKQMFVGKAGLIVVGELETKLGIEQYIGFDDNGDLDQVRGVHFNSITTSSKNPIYQLKYHFASNEEKIGMTYLTEDVKTKETILNVGVVNFEGDLELTGTKSFYGLSNQKNSEMELNVFLGDFRGIVVGYSELKEKGKLETKESTLALFVENEKRAFQFRVMPEDEVLHSMNLSKGPDGTMVVSGFFGQQEDMYMNVYAGIFDLNELSPTKEVISSLENLEIFRNEWFSTDVKMEPAVGSDYKIHTAKFTRSGMIFIYANRNMVTVKEDEKMTEVNKDQLFFRMNIDGSMVQSYIIPYRQNVLTYDKEMEVPVVEEITKNNSEMVFVGENEAVVLYKRSNFDKRMDLKDGEVFYPIVLKFKINEGVFDDVEPLQRAKGSFETEFINGYLNLNRKFNR